MKKIMLLSLIVAFFITSTSAQNSNAGRKTIDKKSSINKGHKLAKKDESTTLSLTSTSANEAYNASANSLRIADPTINAYNLKAAGADSKLSGTGLAGMPKGMYGFANGKIFLRTTTASSPGTSYGSGAVGTGTSINSIGTSEATIGVNGKNPYAGSWLWGSKQPVYNVPVKSTTGNNQ